MLRVRNLFVGDDLSGLTRTVALSGRRSKTREHRATEDGV
jgi:hypothetical protein